MEYRQFGKLGFKVSALGFGCMRLPVLGDDKSRIDEPEAIRMLHYAIDHGVTYVDTAYGYHGGNSERLVGKALQGGYREKVTLATKLPCPLVTARADFDRLLDEQLEKLRQDHVDVYLLHGLRKSRWDVVRDLGVVEWAESAMADGRIGCLGFSFHDGFEVFREIVDYYDGWACCQIQYNYMDEQTQAGTKGLQYAASKGLAVIVMEPLLGGNLVAPPASIQVLWDSASPRRSAAEWGLRWVWNHPEVSVVLSGMGTMDQVRENVESASRSGSNILTEGELGLVAAVRDRYNASRPVPCTQCGYCMPCPNGLDIPTNFLHLNRGVVYDRLDLSRTRYGRMPEEQRAGSCVQCRECEDKCPQSIPIGDWMPIVHRVLGEGAEYSPTLRPGR